MIRFDVDDLLYGCVVGELGLVCVSHAVDAADAADAASSVATPAGAAPPPGDLCGGGRIESVLDATASLTDAEGLDPATQRAPAATVPARTCHRSGRGRSAWWLYASLLLLAVGVTDGASLLSSSPPNGIGGLFSQPGRGRFMPRPRIIALRNRPRAFQLLDYEVGTMGGVNGVCARKLATLAGFEGDAPVCDTSLPLLPARTPRWTADAKARGLVSCGGLLAKGGGGGLPALARLCAARGSRLTCHTPPLPDWLRKAPSGYLGLALQTGCVDLVEHPSMAAYSAAVKLAAAVADEEGTHRFVPQGGAWPLAEPGVAALAREIDEWWRTRPGGGLDVPRLRPSARALDVVIPSGTGTTALFLARHVPPGVTVYAVPCKGNSSTLIARMRTLDERTGGVGRLPTVLPPPPSHTVTLGTAAVPLLTAWRDASDSGVLLDLTYGPVAWAALEHCGWRPHSPPVLTADGAAGGEKNDAANAAHGGEGEGHDGDEEVSRDIMLVNTGGHEGLEAQLVRYARGGHLRKWERGLFRRWEPPASPRSSRGGHDYQRDPSDHMPVDVRRVDELLTERNNAKRARDFNLADTLRDQLRTLNVEVMDREKIWKVRGSDQWEVSELIAEARRVAAARMGLVHTRDAGL